MPTYEYVCSACENQWEEIQKISEPPIEVCPKCAQHTAKRQISGGNFILKGGGWYADLYASSPKSATKSESAGAASSSSSSSASGAGASAAPGGSSGGSSSGSSSGSSET